jgi:tetratricopeptide (TPR) repeat protein
MGLILFNARRYDESMREYRDLLALGSNEVNALWGIGLVLMAKHQADQALPVLEKAVSVSDRSPGIVGGLVMAYAQAGRRRDALRLLAELKKREQPGYSGSFVIAYLGLGDYDEAFAWLDRGYKEQANIMQFLLFADVPRRKQNFPSTARRSHTPAKSVKYREASALRWQTSAGSSWWRPTLGRVHFRCLRASFEKRFSLRAPSKFRILKRDNENASRRASP